MLGRPGLAGSIPQWLPKASKGAAESLTRPRDGASTVACTRWSTAAQKSGEPGAAKPPGSGAKLNALIQVPYTVAYLAARVSHEHWSESELATIWWVNGSSLFAATSSASGTAPPWRGPSLTKRGLSKRWAKA